MPKPKPTEIIRHEIVLGRTEKDLLESVVFGYNFNRVTTPVVAALSDGTFVAVLGTLIGGWLGYNFLADEYDVPGMMAQLKEMLELAAKEGPMAGAIIEDQIGETDMSGNLTLAARLALAGYPPTTVNFLRYYLGLLPGVQ